jgi:predicted nucleotidyltransferase
MTLPPTPKRRTLAELGRLLLTEYRLSMTFTPDTALSLARDVADLLKRKFGATRVLLFGSRAKGRYTPESDIDIYFEGVPEDRALEAVGACISLFGEKSIDYRPDCFCTPHFKSRVLAEGKPL